MTNEEKYSIKLKEEIDEDGIEITEDVKKLLEEIDGYYETLFNEKFERKIINENDVNEIKREIKRVEGIFDRLNESLRRNSEIINKIE